MKAGKKNKNNNKTTVESWQNDNNNIEISQL